MSYLDLYPRSIPTTLPAEDRLELERQARLLDLEQRLRDLEGHNTYPETSFYVPGTFGTSSTGWTYDGPLTVDVPAGRQLLLIRAAAQVRHVCDTSGGSCAYGRARLGINISGTVQTVFSHAAGFALDSTTYFESGVRMVFIPGGGRIQIYLGMKVHASPGYLPGSGYFSGRYLWAKPL